MPRATHEDAINEQTFNRLVDATDQLDEPFQTECRFILVAGGRLGLRGGEIAHFHRDWINWERSMIEIPAWDPCTKGRDGGRCGYCKKRARSAAERDDGLRFEDALKERWEPKTTAGARAVPYDYDDWVAQEIEDFCWQFDRYEHSRVSVNRRVTRVAEAAGLPGDSIYPHALRSTAVSYHAYRGLPVSAMMAMFGWSKLEVAKRYMRRSGSATAEALHSAHQD